MVSVDTISTRGLGDRSYLATDGEVAVVIDPQRDIDRVSRLLTDRGVRLTHVLETHIHNDYVSGGYELARATGATYVVAAGDEVAFDRLGVADGDVITTGRLRLRVLHTPGHTHAHVSYVLADGAGAVHGVFTGGSMLFGATGRTDLVGPDHTQALTHAQFHSVRRLAAELPPETPVYPTHGFGSFCSATPTSGDASTVGAEADSNPALTLDEQAYVDTLLAGLDVYPAYYVHMAPINRAGPPDVDLSDPRPVEPEELRRRLEAGEWVVDLRSRAAFAAGHLPGTLNLEGGDSFVTYLGWLYAWGAPLTLIGASLDEVRVARRELVRIGIDTVAGAAAGDIEMLAAGAELRSYRVSDFAGLLQAFASGQPQVLDARRHDERRAGYVRGSRHIPLHELAARHTEVPDGEVWVYCASGYRAAIAASMLDTPRRQLVLIDDDFDGAADHHPTLMENHP
jgi:glyoxylase-like metal-dependent hydrolase (beta-lactamase superfamily II)/rhodanese-related sulfurtransferase